MINEKPILEVIKAGMLSTIQDLGRYGFQQYGVSVSGAMDSYSLRMANLLIGNEEGEACIEVTLVGPTLRFLHTSRIVITGGDLSPMVNDHPIPMWKCIEVPEGSILSFGKIKSGCRTYIALEGGVQVPILMGSRSTYLRAEIGGFQGRKLQAGDILNQNIKPIVQRPRKHINRSLDPTLIPKYTNTTTIRFVSGSHWHLFTEVSQANFLNQPYLISPMSDRMGYRLIGEILHLKQSFEPISEATPIGTIQVPGEGLPIVLMADRQTTGGYPKIGTCITVDLSFIAQAKPGDEMRFQLVSIEYSHELLKAQEQVFARLRAVNRSDVY